MQYDACNIYKSEICDRIAQNSRRRKWEYTVVKVLLSMPNGTLFEGCNKLKVYVINPKVKVKVLITSALCDSLVYRSPSCLSMWNSQSKITGVQIKKNLLSVLCSSYQEGYGLCLSQSLPDMRNTD